jgi:hypothetical protein
MDYRSTRCFLKHYALSLEAPQKSLYFGRKKRAKDYLNMQIAAASLPQGSRPQNKRWAPVITVARSY